jgi:acyl carrier protein
MELEKLTEIISKVMNMDASEITEDTTFVGDLGADSLSVFEIIVGIEEEFDIELDSEGTQQIVTVGDAVDQIRNIMR